MGLLGETRALKAIAESVATLAIEVHDLTAQRKHEFDWLKSHAGLATEKDLREWKNDMAIKLADVKKIVADAAGQNREAFGEISKRLSDLQTQIDDLIANAGDPDITDEAFLADLESLKTDAKALADVVPTPQA